MQFLLRRGKMGNSICEFWAGLFAAPLKLTGLLLLMIVIVTWKAKPWKNRYGSPAWDFSTSFASNLAALTAAINTIFAAASVIGLNPNQKTEKALGIAVFAIFTACAPLVASFWKTPANETFFAGVVFGVSTTAFGVFGQLQILIQLVCPAQKGYAIALFLACIVVFVYCLAVANRLAHTPPVKTLVRAAGEITVLDRWALP
jgi:hypothetical protein